MRRLSILILMLLCAAVSLRAQSLDAFKQRLAEPVAGTAFFGRAQVTVAEHGDAARAVAAASASGLYGVVMFTERKSRAARNAFASAEVSQSIRSYSQGKPNFAYTALYITGDFE